MSEKASKLRNFLSALLWPLCLAALLSAGLGMAYFFVSKSKKAEVVDTAEKKLEQEKQRRIKARREAAKAKARRRKKAVREGAKVLLSELNSTRGPERKDLLAAYEILGTPEAELALKMYYENNKRKKPRRKKPNS